MWFLCLYIRNELYENRGGISVYSCGRNLIPLDQICILLDHKQATSREVRICLEFAPEIF